MTDGLQGSRSRIARLVETRPGLSRTVLGMSLAGSAGAAIVYRVVVAAGTSVELQVAFYAALGASAVALVIAFLAERLPSYYAAQAVRVLAYLLTVPRTANVPLAGYLLLAGVLGELSFWEPYPLNLGETIGVTAAAFLLSLLSTRTVASNVVAWVVQQLPLALFGTLVSLFGCHMTRFREVAADLLQEKERLTNSVVELTRANSAYQDFAVTARETAAETERQRITRDIHDVVGYTLTNNIMLLEAALDLMQDNPLGLPTIIETARANAEEGLGRIRSALYRLRRQEESSASGLKAIHRLAHVFEQATSIRVRCEFGNLPWSISEKVDSTLYHLVQESLVNVFRHAQATEVRVVLWHEAGTVKAHITDNGQGGQIIREGIGIRGMRERVEGLGGSFRAEPTPYGFSIAATLPAGAEGEDEDPDTHR